MKWCRLMFGREFPMTDSHTMRYLTHLLTYLLTTYSLTHSLIRIWDHMFATCRSSNVTDASCILRAELNEEAEVPRASQYSPLLMAVSHFMLAMILHIREQLMDSDSTGILGYLLKVTTHSLTHSLTHLLTHSPLSIRLATT